MVGFGTLINVVGIILGGILGIFFGKFLNGKLQDTLMSVCGVSLLFIGVAGAVEKMLSVQNGVLSSGHAMLLTICIVLGAFIGELLKIETGFEKFGQWLKNKTGSSKDTKFIDGFVTASLTVSIGAMAIVGAIEDGIFGDWSILATKTILIS